MAHSYLTLFYSWSFPPPWNSALQFLNIILSWLPFTSWAAPSLASMPGHLSPPWSVNIGVLKAQPVGVFSFHSTLIPLGITFTCMTLKHIYQLLTTKHVHPSLDTALVGVILVSITDKPRNLKATKAYFLFSVYNKHPYLAGGFRPSLLRSCGSALLCQQSLSMGKEMGASCLWSVHSLCLEMMNISVLTFSG